MYTHTLIKAFTYAYIVLVVYTMLCNPYFIQYIIGLTEKYIPWLMIELESSFSYVHIVKGVGGGAGDLTKGGGTDFRLPPINLPDEPRQPGAPAVPNLAIPAPLPIPNLPIPAPHFAPAPPLPQIPQFAPVPQLPWAQPVQPDGVGVGVADDSEDELDNVDVGLGVADDWEDHVDHAALAAELAQIDAHYAAEVDRIYAEHAARAAQFAAEHANWGIGRMFIFGGVVVLAFTFTLGLEYITRKKK